MLLSLQTQSNHPIDKSIRSHTYSKVNKKGSKIGQQNWVKLHHIQNDIQKPQKRTLKWLKRFKAWFVNVNIYALYCQPKYQKLYSVAKSTKLTYGMRYLQLSRVAVHKMLTDSPLLFSFNLTFYFLHSKQKVIESLLFYFIFRKEKKMHIGQAQFKGVLFKFNSLLSRA